ncbi:hypothetical protein EA658_13805 [Pseudoxanthomonas winnipegensis]|uniref:Uncharacterized protein n=1 Tax=Pseudoxanthomonas winnipegensis TaxID=2480810 RepID=A0ABY1WB30_9GAMM|nr:hypothetical protein [Pseudoxanthomonas winnipegensis]TAA18216.1 hypothetical protein EA658_13805 [Pseudoxanthomonas winnipegensis]
MTARTLPLDVSRCVGRLGGLGPDDDICPRRDQCLRYLALLDHPAHQPIPLRVPVHTALCRDGEDWMIGGAA